MREKQIKNVAWSTFRYFVLAFLLCLSVVPLRGQPDAAVLSSPSADSLIIFSYPSRIRMFKTEYADNRLSLRKLKKRLRTFRKRQDTLYVQSYSGSWDDEKSNLRAAYWQCQQSERLSYRPLRTARAAFPDTQPPVGSSLVGRSRRGRLPRFPRLPKRDSAKPARACKCGEATGTTGSPSGCPCRETKSLLTLPPWRHGCCAGCSYCTCCTRCSYCSFYFGCFFCFSYSFFFHRFHLYSYLAFTSRQRSLPWRENQPWPLGRARL